MYTDLNGYRVNGGTLPPDLCETQQRPDLVVIMKATTKVLLVELTIPWDSQSNFNGTPSRPWTWRTEVGLSQISP